MPYAVYESLFNLDESNLNSIAVIQTHLIISMLVAVFSLSFLSVLMPLHSFAGWVGESIFYWGDEKIRYDRISSIKRNIFWVGIVGLSISLIGGVIVYLATR